MEAAVPALKRPMGEQRRKPCKPLTVEGYLLKHMERQQLYLQLIDTYGAK